MRRKEREITNIEEIINIISKCDTMRLGLFDGEMPYIVPMNFGFEKKGNNVFFYFHCALEGRKIDILKRNPKVCFECDRPGNIITGEKACDASLDGYESVIGEGVIEFLPDEEKTYAFDKILDRYTGGKKLPYRDEILKKTLALKLCVKTITGKRK